MSSDKTVKIWDARPLAPELQAEREAVGLLDYLFSRPLPKTEVLSRIRAYPSTTEEIRKLALDLAERYREEQDPRRFDEAARSLVRQRFLAPRWYQEALLQAETACQLVPKNELYQTTLALAQYRKGKHAEAVGTLRPLGETKVSTPAVLAFLSMAHQQLGRKDKADEYLNRLHEAMEQPKWAKNEEAQGFLREAEALLKGTVEEPKP